MFQFISLVFFVTFPFFFVKSCIQIYKKYKKDRDYRKWRRRYDAESKRIDREIEELHSSFFSPF